MKNENVMTTFYQMSWPLCLLISTGQSIIVYYFFGLYLVCFFICYIFFAIYKPELLQSEEYRIEEYRIKEKMNKQ
jgi:hypothetical protein